MGGFAIPQVSYVPFFIALFLIFRFAQNFNDPFVVGLLRVMTNREFNSLKYRFRLLGSAFGPLTAGLMVGDDQIMKIGLAIFYIYILCILFVL